MPESRERGQHPYIPNTGEQVEEMLRLIGISSIDDLFSDIPTELLNPPLDLPAPMNELQLSMHMARLAGKNVVGLPTFLGAGDYSHFIPSVVGRVSALPGFFSAYTPYQPEISQGTLTSAFEYQTMAFEFKKMGGF